MREIFFPHIYKGSKIMAHADPTLKNEVVSSVREPSLYKVVYLNDNITSFEFVIETLIGIFEYNMEMANRITKEIHENGSAVVAVLPFELAEQKTYEVLQSAKASKFPLNAFIEPAE